MTIVDLIWRVLFAAACCGVLTALFLHVCVRLMWRDVMAKGRAAENHLSKLLGPEYAGHAIVFDYDGQAHVLRWSPPQPPGDPVEKPPVHRGSGVGGVGGMGVVVPIGARRKAVANG